MYRETEKLSEVQIKNILLENPDLDDITKAQVGGFVNKIKLKTRVEQNKLIHLTKKYIDYISLKEMSSLIKDKLDPKSWTGFSAENYLASCRNPTENRLFYAVNVFRELKKADFLDADQIDGLKGQFMGDLRTSIKNYKDSYLVGKGDNVKKDIINDILINILSASSNDEKRLENARKILFQLESKGSGFNDVKRMFSKACIICGGLSNDDTLLNLGSRFDKDLKESILTNMACFIAVRLNECTHTLNSCLNYLAKGIGYWLESEEKCVDRLIKKQITEEDNSIESQTLQQLYQARQFVSVQKNQQSCYEMYTNLKKMGYLIPSLTNEVKTTIKSCENLDDDDKILDKIEQSRDDLIYLNMHTVHDIMSHIKTYCVESGLKKQYEAIEHLLKKIKIKADLIPNQRAQSTSFILGNSKSNQGVFSLIDKRLDEMVLSSSSDNNKIKLSEYLQQLKSAIDTLKKTTVNTLHNEKFQQKAEQYVSEHFDANNRALKLEQTESNEKPRSRQLF